MFKKDLQSSSKTKLKSSAQRNIRSLLCRTYPLLAPHIDAILPKKSQLDTARLPEARATLYILNGKPLFYQHMSDALIPHLFLVHQYPDCFPRVRVDRGAIRFVISGASLMTPGFTSPGGRLPSGKVPPERVPQSAEDGDKDEEDDDDLAQGAAAGVPYGAGLSTSDDKRYLEQPELDEGAVVVVEAEGKEHACAIGALKMGTKEMKEKKKGVGIESAHYIGDGLWRVKTD